MSDEVKVVNGRTFDRRVQFDERSRNFPIRAAVPRKFRSFTWSVDAYLDQGQEGACVGFAWAHELAARPVVARWVTNEFARDHIYREAQKIDEWPGESYSGTSVLAGAKVVIRLGGMTEYRWGFGLDDLRLGVGHEGPAVLGIPWHEGMFEPDDSGLIHVTGAVAGGHAICCFGVNEKTKVLRLHNSWGRDWGQNGNCSISFEDMAKLLANEGEACFPVGRMKIKDPQ